jgi:L-seryl-tRNA(Ser) seleniumtransferase
MENRNKFALLPSVDALFNHELSKDFLQKFSHDILRQKFRAVVHQYREEITAGQHKNVKTRDDFTKLVLCTVQNEIQKELSASLRSVINASGVILHTGLGRALLSVSAQQNVMEVIRSYSNVEIDLENGKRGDRGSHVSNLLCQLTGAEAAVVVNNNAAAVFIILNTLSFGKEAVISRGEQIEIGGSFRMPDVMEKSGAVMREIGTTNKSKLMDYKNALSDRTGAIVVAHTSNYRVVGFTESVDLHELAELAHDHSVPLYHDLGGGVLLDLQRFGLPHEPMVQDSLRAGADVVSFSGDKMLGGPQCGIIAGRADYIERIKRNPIMRVVRCCKMTYAALEATLKLFLNERTLLQDHKVMGMFTCPVEEVKRRAEILRDKIKADKNIEIQVESSFCQAGSGTMPLEKIPSYAVVIKSVDVSAQDIYSQLLHNEPPIVGYVQNDRVYLDIRTVADEEVENLCRAVKTVIVNQ